MNGEFLEDTEVIRITNEEFIPVKRDDLAGNFDLTLSISTAEADNDKAQELAFMLQTMGNNMDPKMSQMILADIARLRKMPALAKQIESYEPQPDPMQVKKAELELKLLEAQIYNEEAKGNENNANAELDTAKANTERATAGNVSSDTDLKNLEYLEKESGTHQERDLEKLDRQSGNKMKENAIQTEHDAKIAKDQPAISAGLSKV